MNFGYALIMLLAIASGFMISRFTQSGLRLTWSERLGIGTSAFVGAMFGAKFPFLFEGWDAFLSGASWFSDGKTILTGLVGGYLGRGSRQVDLGDHPTDGRQFRGPGRRGGRHRSARLFLWRLLLRATDPFAVGRRVFFGR